MPFDLRSPHVRVDIRPATLEELTSVVEMRLEVFCPHAQTHTHTQTNPEAAAIEWKERSLQNMMARREKGAVVLVATAQDVRKPQAKPVLVGSIEYSTHEFKEVGFSPCLSMNPLAGEEEEEEDEEDVRERFDFVMEEEEGGSGYCYRRRGAGGSKKKSEKQIYVTGVMVKNQFRRQGIGGSLLQAVDEHAHLMDIHYLCMFVEASNQQAMTLYQRAGYHLVPFSQQAEAFASAIGLYKGPFAARQYSFAYKRLSQQQQQPSSPSFKTSAAAGASAISASGSKTVEMEEKKEKQEKELTSSGSRGIGSGVSSAWYSPSFLQEQKQQQQQQQQQQEEEKKSAEIKPSLLQEPHKPFPARASRWISPF